MANGAHSVMYVIVAEKSSEIREASLPEFTIYEATREPHWRGERGEFKRLTKRRKQQKTTTENTASKKKRQREKKKKSNRG